MTKSNKASETGATFSLTTPTFLGGKWVIRLRTPMSIHALAFRLAFETLPEVEQLIDCKHTLIVFIPNKLYSEEEVKAAVARQVTEILDGIMHLPSYSARHRTDIVDSTITVFYDKETYTDSELIEQLCERLRKDEGVHAVEHGVDPTITITAKPAYIPGEVGRRVKRVVDETLSGNTYYLNQR